MLSCPHVQIIPEKASKLQLQFIEASSNNAGGAALTSAGCTSTGFAYDFVFTATNPDSIRLP